MDRGIFNGSHGEIRLWADWGISESESGPLGNMGNDCESSEITLQRGRMILEWYCVFIYLIFRWIYRWRNCMKWMNHFTTGMVDLVYFVTLPLFVFTSDTWRLVAPGLQEPFWQRVFGGEATRDNWMEERYARLFGAPQGMEGKVGPVLGSFRLPKTCRDLFIRILFTQQLHMLGLLFT